MIYNNEGDGIVGGVYGNDELISDNTVYDNSEANAGDPTDGITVSVWNATIIGNVVYDNQGIGIGVTGDAPAAGDGEVVVVNNTVYGNTSAGISADQASVSDNVVYDDGYGILAVTLADADLGVSLLGPAAIDGNRVFDNTDAGIVAEADSTVAGNDVYSNAIGILGTDSYFGDPNNADYSGPFQGLISNNLVYANSSAGIMIADGDGAQVINNTVYQPQGDGVRVTSSTYNTGSGSASYASQDVALLNNIIWTETGYDINVDNDCQEGFASNYNLLYTTELGSIGYWQTSFSDLRDWQLETGLDTDSITGNPMFVNPAGPDGILGYDATTGVDGGSDDDFHLQNDSLAVAAGDPTSDYSAQPVPTGGRINIGIRKHAASNDSGSRWRDRRSAGRSAAGRGRWSEQFDYDRSLQPARR